MSQIKVISNPEESLLENQSIRSWPIWEKEVSEFPWHYDSEETCYILEGRVLVTPEGGAPVEIKVGDLVTFPRGMSCRWDIKEPIRKHYKFG